MTKIMTFIRYYWVAITLLILVVNTALSLWPLEKLPAVPGGDKIHHFVAYAALMFPTALRKPKYWPLICLFFIGWSGAIELLQPQVNRYGEWMDLAANFAGVAGGLLAAKLISFSFPLGSHRQ